MSAFSAGLIWRVSSWSAGSNCIEVAGDKTAILVRDTKNRSRAILSFSPTVWADFVEAVQADSIIFTR
jgi:Domain of unknown function (DUF397)